MLVLQQISRNVRIKSYVIRYISITETRQDDKKSLSEEEKEKIRNKLKSLKHRLRTQPNVEEAEGPVPVKVPIKKPAFVKQEEKTKDGQKMTLKSLLQQQIKTEEEVIKDDEVVVEKKIEPSGHFKKLVENAKEQKDAKKRLEYKKSILKLLDEEPTKEEEDEGYEKLKGKQRMHQLLEEPDETKVDEKVEIPRPVKTDRPVEKAAKKAETSDHVKMLKSIKGVADKLGGDVRKTESELMDMVFKSEASEESERKRLEKPKKSKMSNVIGDMHIDSRKDDKDNHQADVRRTLAMIRELQQQASGRREPRERGSYEYGYVRTEYPLFDRKPLNIFDEDYIKDFQKLEETPVTETYDRIKQKELIKLITHTPANIYEEMIKWTKEGKLWHFPIDNEWKYEWEENVDFSEHVLLEHHLEPWCPSGGPIRHFMELVCVGLGKNPFITAEEKREHIYWFRDYFEEKRRLLEDVGAFKTEKKQIEQGK